MFDFNGRAGDFDEVVFRAAIGDQISVNLERCGVQINGVATCSAEAEAL